MNVANTSWPEDSKNNLLPHCLRTRPTDYQYMGLTLLELSLLLRQATPIKKNLDNTSYLYILQVHQSSFHDQWINSTWDTTHTSEMEILQHTSVCAETSHMAQTMTSGKKSALATIRKGWAQEEDEWLTNTKVFENDQNYISIPL